MKEKIIKGLKFTTSTTATFTVPDWDEFFEDCHEQATSHDFNNYLELCFDEYDELLHSEDIRPAVSRFLRAVDYTLRLKGVEPDAVGFLR